VLNLTVIAFVFPGVVKREDWTKVGDSPLTNLTIAFMVLVVLAYAVSPLIPLFQGALDGTLLPEPLHNVLRNQRVGQARRLRKARRDASNRFNDLDLMISNQPTSLHNRLRKAYEGGQNAASQLDSKSHPELENSIAELGRALEKGRTPDTEKIESVAAILEKALATARVRAGAPLDSAQRSFVALLQDARQDAYHRWTTLVARDRGLALNSPQATQIGDARNCRELCVRGIRSGLRLSVASAPTCHLEG
jgi:hypothetical protein